MKQLLASFLLSSYFSSVFMLECLDCTSDSGQCDTEQKRKCDDHQICATWKYRVLVSAVNIHQTEVKRCCYSKKECERWNVLDGGMTLSGNIGMASGTMFLSCCDSDNCNNIAIPDLEGKPNGLQCLSCNSLTDTVCDTPVSCVGNEDYCIQIKDESPVFWTPVEKGYTLGCASKAVCDRLTKNLKSNQTLCCSESLCNKL